MWTLKIVENYPRATFKFESYADLTDCLAYLATHAVDKITYEVSYEKEEDNEPVRD